MANVNLSAHDPNDESVNGSSRHSPKYENSSPHLASNGHENADTLALNPAEEETKGLTEQEMSGPPTDANQATGEFLADAPSMATGHFAAAPTDKSNFVTCDASDAGATQAYDFAKSSHEPSNDFSFDPASADSEDSTDKPGRGVALPKRVGDYDIRSVLGRGGMGVVYRARHRKLGREVALKMVLAGAHASSDQLQRFIIEAQAVAHLQHPNIVQIFEVSEQNGLPYFSLEFVDGMPLDARLKQSMLGDKEAAKLMVTICLAMQYAHDNNILHRDLKPANVLLTRDGIPKVTDFGLAKKLEGEDGSASTRTGTVMGTPSYMSPEQAMGQVKELGPATDQYSLGAMLYELLTGRPPFIGAKPIETIMQVVRAEAVHPRQIRASCPMDLETICLKALQKEPAKRYESCAALAADLQRYLDGKPILARPVSQVEVFGRWCKRNPLVASLCAIATVLLVTIAGVSTYFAQTVAAKNEELGRTNGRLEESLTKVSEQKLELENKNAELGASIAESTRRSVRLQEYVQDVFRSINQLNIVDVPRAKPFRNQLLHKTLPLLDEIVPELLATAQAMPTKMNGLYSLALSYRDQQMGVEAEKILTELIRLAEGRVELKNGSDAARSNLAVLLMELSRIRLELNRDLQASFETANRALAIAEDVMANPKAAADGKGIHKPSQSRLLLSESLMNLGMLYYRIGDSATAKPMFERSFKLQSEIVLSELPDDRAASAEQAKLKNQLARASVLFRSGEPDTARPLCEDAVKQARENLLADPLSPALKSQLAGFVGMWGEYLALIGESEAALNALAEAASLSDDLISQKLDSLEFNRTAAVAYYRLSQWHPDDETSRAYGKKALALRYEIMKGEPENAKFRIHWMNSMARCGPLDEAIKVAEEIASSEKPDSELLLDTARAFCQCAARCQQATRRDELLDRSVQLIKQAISLGFRDLSFNQSDRDLQPLTAKLDLRSLQ